MSDALPVHGGDLGAIARRYGVDASSLLDFSANLNPLGPPPALLRELERGARDVAALARYPEPDAHSIRVALGAHLGVDPESVAVANGAAALISAALPALGAERCIAPVPAFSEDRHAARIANAEFCRVRLDPRTGFALRAAAVLDEVAGPGDVVLITNPHNPTGGVMPRDAVLALAGAVAERGGATIVDEAFVDYAADCAISRDAATHPALVSVRSLTKLYAVPALRVGYAVARPRIARALREHLPSWPVTQLAADAVAAALGDGAYLRRTLEANERARTALTSGLDSLGFAVLPAAANYVFVELPKRWPNASIVTATLIRDARIVVRDCTSYEGLESGRYLRIAVRDENGNATLLAALRKFGDATP